MGIVRDMIDAGVWLDCARSLVDGQIVESRIDLSDLPFSALGLPQNHTERLLTRHLSSFAIDVEHGVTLEGLSQSDGRVHGVLTNTDGKREEATFRYVIGCDGAHSAVRKALGISFEGNVIPAEFLLGDVKIAWSVPRGTVLRLLKMRPDSAPDIFVAIPLPEPGRYRVSTMAPPELAATPGGTDHGIQSERPAPGIEHLQVVADQMLPEKVVLSDMRWSSIFRISMRLAAKYRVGNAFIAGDAAHIHPPTGGQGMNTGIQDAYNLAWKMALVLNGAANESLLNSYEAERHAVGRDVVERTSKATQALRVDPEHRLADTQVLISYRGSAWIDNAPADSPNFVGPVAGDLAPDCHGLRRFGVGFAIRMLDILRGVEHVLIAYCPGANPSAAVADLAAFGGNLGLAGLLRIVAIVERGTAPLQPFGAAVYQDVDGGFRDTYGSASPILLVRPDNYLAWRGESWHDAGLRRQLDRTFAFPTR
jgi:2-polyprenyl-6-methoxyphenol hydroxylase-like FAD-dependent oxidoreductase